MAWSIFTVIVIAVVLFLVWNYTVDNPEILEDIDDAVLIRCTISDMLYERLVDVGLNRDQILVLDAMLQGERVLAGDIRDIAKHAKEVSKSVAWNAICYTADS